MFDFFDDSLKSYEISYHDGKKELMTAQELYEFVIMNQTDISDSFDSMKRKLDAGSIVLGSDYYYDWNLAANVYKGKLSICKVGISTNSNTYTNSSSSSKCDHEGKYIVQHFNGGVRYWVCPKCKTDLGDA